MDGESFLFGLIMRGDPVELAVADDQFALERACHGLALYSGLPVRHCKRAFLIWINATGLEWRAAFNLIISGDKRWLQFCPPADKSI